MSVYFSSLVNLIFPKKQYPFTLASKDRAIQILSENGIPQELIHLAISYLVVDCGFKEKELRDMFRWLEISTSNPFQTFWEIPAINKVNSLSTTIFSVDKPPREMEGLLEEGMPGFSDMTSSLMRWNTKSFGSALCFKTKTVVRTDPFAQEYPLGFFELQLGTDGRFLGDGYPNTRYIDEDTTEKLMVVYSMRNLGKNNLCWMERTGVTTSIRYSLFYRALGSVPEKTVISIKDYPPPYAVRHNSKHCMLFYDPENQTQEDGKFSLCPNYSISRIPNICLDDRPSVSTNKKRTMNDKHDQAPAKKQKIG